MKFPFSSLHNHPSPHQTYFERAMGIRKLLTFNALSGYFFILLGVGGSPPRVVRRTYTGYLLDGGTSCLECEEAEGRRVVIMIVDSWSYLSITHEPVGGNGFIVWIYP